jgi:hypothetical protein
MVLYKYTSTCVAFSGDVELSALVLWELLPCCPVLHFIRCGQEKELES